MSAAGPNSERHTDNTQAGENYLNLRVRNSTEDVPLRFNSDQASPTDNPDDNAPFQPSIPSKSHPSFPSSQAELKEQIGEDTWRYDIPKNEDAWKTCNEMTQKYDNEMCDAWKDEVDKLLIFAGLFSGVVTAFTTQSYQWLSEQSVDSSARLLSFVAWQLANSTNPLPPSLTVPEFAVTQAQIRINVVWFLSLTLSLTTVLVGILCLQWLREFQRVAALPHKDAFALRQMRYEGLIQWRVPDILSTLPLLLQLSLILFFVGLLDLLWSLNTLVASCVSAVVSMVMVFLMTTTALPALQHALTKDGNLRIFQCPYKSPQAWLFYCTWQCLVRLINPLARWTVGFHSTRFSPFRRSSDDTNWLAYDMRWRRLRDTTTVNWGAPVTIQDSDDVVDGLRWINNTFPQSVEAVFSVYHALAELDISAATAAIFSFYPNLGLVSSMTFRAMMEQPSSTETQKRDVVAAYYLTLHRDRHPLLKIGYVETVIRILNTQDVPRPFYHRLSGILLDLVTRQQQPLLALSSSRAVTQSNTEKITVNVLLCVKYLIARDLLRSTDVVLAWDLLRRLLTPPTPPPPNHRYCTHTVDSEQPKLGLGLNIDHIKLACSLFQELKGWLSRGEEMDGWDLSVKLCTASMIKLFPSSIDIAALNVMCPLQLGKAAGLVRALDVHLRRLRGLAGVDFDDWARLVSRFELLKEGDSV